MVSLIAFESRGEDGQRSHIGESNIITRGANKFPEIYVSELNASFYADQDETAQPVWSLDWVSELRVDMRRMKTAKPGWLPIAPLGRVRKDNKSKWIEIPAGWVRRRDVVLSSEYKKVTACWPIKHVEYTAGDYEVRIEFKPDGTGLAQDNSGMPAANIKMQTQVSMGKNIVDISAVGANRRYFFTAGYSTSERRIYPHGTLNDIVQEPFGEAEIGNCKGLPTLTN
jgi:hypothetical protein